MGTDDLIISIITFNVPQHPKKAMMTMIALEAVRIMADVV